MEVDNKIEELTKSSSNFISVPADSNHVKTINSPNNCHINPPGEWLNNSPITSNRNANSLKAVCFAICEICGLLIYHSENSFEYKIHKSDEKKYICKKCHVINERISLQSKSYAPKNIVEAADRLPNVNHHELFTNSCAKELSDKFCQVNFNQSILMNPMNENTNFAIPHETYDLEEKKKSMHNERYFKTLNNPPCILPSQTAVDNLSCDNTKMKIDKKYPTQFPIVKCIKESTKIKQNKNFIANRIFHAADLPQKEFTKELSPVRCVKHFDKLNENMLPHIKNKPLKPDRIRIPIREYDLQNIDEEIKAIFDRFVNKNTLKYLEEGDCKESKLDASRSQPLVLNMDSSSEEDLMKDDDELSHGEILSSISDRINKIIKEEINKISSSRQKNANSSISFQNPSETVFNEKTSDVENKKRQIFNHLRHNGEKPHQHNVRVLQSCQVNDREYLEDITHEDDTNSDEKYDKPIYLSKLNSKKKKELDNQNSKKQILAAVVSREHFLSEKRKHESVSGMSTDVVDGSVNPTIIARVVTHENFLKEQELHNKTTNKIVRNKTLETYLVEPSQTLASKI